MIEAKLLIQNQREMEDVKIQARSYAVQLKAKYSAIADKNKIWIYSCNDDYTNEIFTAAWDELNNPDNFSKLFKLIGKKITFHQFSAEHLAPQVQVIKLR